jgi:hypothetical protein
MRRLASIPFTSLSCKVCRSFHTILTKKLSVSCVKAKPCCAEGDVSFSVQFRLQPTYIVPWGSALPAPTP